MALSCGEVMYGAYYPYLYGRGAARTFHHAPHFQYDRFSSAASGAAYGGGGGGGGGGGSASGSSGAQSPSSPLLAPSASARLRAKEEDLSAHGRASADGVSSESEGECGAAAASAAGGSRRAQYVSANCVVFTHYAGDAAAVVDEHFARALAHDKHKDGVPMVSRNLPASFFNAAACGGLSAAGGACGGMELYEYDPWAHAQHYGGYGRHAEYHAGAAPMGYGGLLLGRAVPQYKPVDWPGVGVGQQHLDHHPHAAHHAAHHATHCAPYSYPGMPGLEAPVQDGSKDLYWF